MRATPVISSTTELDRLFELYWRYVLGKSPLKIITDREMAEIYDMHNLFWVVTLQS